MTTAPSSGLLSIRIGIRRESNEEDIKKARGNSRRNKRQQVQLHFEKFRCGFRLELKLQCHYYRVS